jgi:plasmid stabilization system protein ParE
MSFRVQMTERAQADLDRLIQVLSERSPEAAARFAARFHEALSRLETNPFASGLAFENPHFAEELRHLLIRTQKRRAYRALYVVRETEVVIVAVRAPGERPISPSDIEDPG